MKTINPFPRATQVRDKKTGERLSAEYGPNNKGNLQYWVNGKFYPDKEFGRKFEIVRTNFDE